MTEGCTPPPPHTFQCSQYDSWDPNTYSVPVGDFCSGQLIPPAKPECANGNVDGPKITIKDREGTDCTIKMYNSPGTKHDIMSLVCYRNLFLDPGEQTNDDCLNKITTEIGGKSETWLVFITHGFTDSGSSTWLSTLRETILQRYDLLWYQNAANLLCWHCNKSSKQYVNPELNLQV